MRRNVGDVIQLGKQGPEVEVRWEHSMSSTTLTHIG
jgi:hypothetical protein